MTLSAASLNQRHLILGQKHRVICIIIFRPAQAEIPTSGQFKTGTNNKLTKNDQVISFFHEREPIYAWAKKKNNNNNKNNSTNKIIPAAYPFIESDYFCPLWIDSLD